MTWCVFAIILGFLLDTVIGDPQRMPHPVRAIGKGIAWGEGFFRPRFAQTQEGQRRAGMVMSLCVIALATVIPAVILALLGMLDVWLRFLAETIFCYQIFAARSLQTESMKVFDALKEGNLLRARYAVSMIVGRDTDELDEEGIAKAAVETVAENTSDGVLAPMFYMVIGGAPLGFLYKAVNTLDSMIGYKNERYADFGRFAAKLDDVLNYIPARISAAFLVAAAFCARMDYKSAWRIYKRDGRNHASPNSAQTEAAVAGALGVQLAGDAWYFGKRVEKPTIGDDLRQVVPEDILRANRLMYVAATLLLVSACAARIGILYLIFGGEIWVV